MPHVGPRRKGTGCQDLAARGYYTPAKWAPLIGSSIPPGIPGADADEQAANYAQLLAAQVRIAFPTAVMADQTIRHSATMVRRLLRSMSQDSGKPSTT